MYPSDDPRDWLSKFKKMKTLTWLSTLALTCLAIPFFASAQIAPSGIFREQPTPTPQPSPTETPAEATTPKDESTPAPKPERKPAAKTIEKPAKKAEKKSAQPSPNPPVVDNDQRPSGSGAGTIAMLRQMEKEWEASPNNPAIIQRMVADDFTGVTNEGKIVTKKLMLKGSNEEKADGSTSVGHMDIRLYTPTVAIVVGTAKQSTKDKAGKKSTTSYRFTDTWMERGGNWQCIAGQATALPKSDEDGAFLPTNFQTGSHLPRRRY
jgi:Domain of unknown function (DUF4440)